MSENEFDVERDRAEDERDNVVLTGEEIELPGEGSDASAIIGESSEPIHTGEIESVAIGSLKARVPATAPLKPAIEDKISTGELPVVSAAHEAGAASGAEDAPADASSDAPEADGSAQREGEASESEAATSEAEVASSDEATTAEGAEASKDNEEPVSAVGGAAAEATHTLASRRSMIFGDEEPVSPSIPALSPAEQQVGASSAQEPAERDTASDEEATKDSVTALVDGPTKQLPTQATSYSFADQDQAEAERPRRRSLLNADDDERDAATLAAIASANRDRSENTKEPAGLDDELFSAAPVVTEMPSRRGAHFLSLLLFLVLTPLGWYLASDAGARMTLADAAPMYTGVASILALGELLGAIVVAVILFAAARRSSLGAWIMGVATLIVGLPWVLAPGITASTLLASLNALSASSSLGANLSHHLQASGYSGRFAILGIVLMGVGYLSHSARRTGRAEEALRTSIEAVNPAGAFYSKRARKKAAKDLNSK